MWIEMFTQFCHIRGLSTSVWSTVACAVGMSEIVLVDDCVMSALTQVAYVFYKTQPARQYPYVLNRGDKTANVENLRAMESRPADETIGKSWELLRRGVPVEDLLPGLDLLDG